MICSALFLFMLSLAFAFPALRCGLPSDERLSVELGGPKALAAEAEPIQNFLAGKSQYRSEFVSIAESNPERMRLSPYFDQLRTYHPDEQYILKTISSCVSRRSPDTRNYIYPPFFFYQTAIPLAAGAVLGILPRGMDTFTALNSPEITANIYLCARLFMALAAALGTVLLFFAAFLLTDDPRTAFFTAVLFALYPLCTLSSTLLKPDTLCTFWTIAVFFFSVLAWKRNRRNVFYACLAGIAVGFAAGSKYPGVLSAILPVSFLADRYFSNRRNPDGANSFKKDFLCLAACGVSAFLAFVIPNFVCLLNFKLFLHDFAWIAGVLDGRNNADAFLQFLFCHIFDAVFFYAGPFAVLWFLAALAYPVFAKKRFLLLLYPLPFLFFIFAKNGREGSDVYFLPAFPFLCVFAGAMLAAVKKNFLRELLFILVAGSLVWHACGFALRAAEENVRLSASRELQNRFQPGTKFGRTQYPVSYRTVMLPPEKYPSLYGDVSGADVFLVNSYEFSVKDSSPVRKRLEYLNGRKQSFAPDSGEWKETCVFDRTPPGFAAMLGLGSRTFIISPVFDFVTPVIRVYERMDQNVSE